MTLDEIERAIWSLIPETGGTATRSLTITLTNNRHGHTVEAVRPNPHDQYAKIVRAESLEGLLRALAYSAIPSPAPADKADTADGVSLAPCPGCGRWPNEKTHIKGLPVAMCPWCD